MESYNLWIMGKIYIYQLLKEIAFRYLEVDRRFVLDVSFALKIERGNKKEKNAVFR